MRKEAEYPSVNELVVCTVIQVFDEGAFVSLDEYGGKRGMIHLREVASGWIKNIRDHIRENQKVVCRVISVDPNRRIIDLSIRRVAESEKKHKLKEFEIENRAEKLLLLAAKKLRKNLDKAYREAGFPLMRKYGSLSQAFEQIAQKGEEALKGLSLSRGWVRSLLSVSRGLVRPSVYQVKGYLILTCDKPNGVEVLKNAMLEAKRKVGEKVEFYLEGSPRYRIVARGDSYKEAEEILQEASNAVLAFVKSAGGEGEFRREK